MADVFDAMVSGRAYSGFMDQSDAISRITEERELFDLEILRAMIRAHENGTLTLKTSTANHDVDQIPTPAPSSSTSILEPMKHTPNYSKPKKILS